MSPIDYSAVAQRICAQSTQISALLSSQVYIDYRLADAIDFRSKLSAPPLRRSLTLDEQQEILAGFDQLHAELDNMCRLTGNESARDTPQAASAAAASSKPRAALSRQQSQLKRLASSRESLNYKTLDDTSMPPPPPPPPTAVAAAIDDVPLVTSDAIRAFNASALQNSDSAEVAVDVQAMCERDKQTMRPFFKLVPKLKEFTARIQQVIADAGGKPTATTDDAEAINQQLGELLQRLLKVRLVTILLKTHYDQNINFTSCAKTSIIWRSIRTFTM